MRPDFIEIVEVSPRDGLQSDQITLDTAIKVELIERCVAAGVRRIEVASFVNPARVPQMADAEAVVAALPPRDDVTYVGLVLNRRGFERAAATSLREVNVVAVCTDTFGERNQGATVDQAVATVAEVAGAAAEVGVKVSVVLSVAFGCPYEGEVPVAKVVDVALRVVDTGVSELSLADTIGVAAPTDVADRVAAVASAVGDSASLRCHFHNTRNTGLANAYAAVDAGVRSLDASLGGIGGCPFAPNATGNIPTEDVAYLLARAGIDTGLSLDELAEAAHWLEGVLGRRVPGLYAKAGPFPRAS
jgi:hydroxymethylglutaryl-CoA lyase